MRPDARLRPRPGPAHLALPGRGQGAVRRRGRRGRRRGQPVPGRGRAGADRGRVRAAAAPWSTRSRPWPPGRRWCTRPWSPTAPTSAPSTSARSSATSPRPTSSSPTASAGTARAASRWRPSAPSPSYDPGTGSFTIDTNSLSFTSYLFMAANTLKVPANKLDIRPVPAGGSFGSKLFANKPAVIAGMCARETGRQVAYLEDRTDNISNCDHHGSDRVYEVELAMMRDGTMRGIKIDVVDDYGAYIQFGVGPPRQRPGPGHRPVHDRQRAVPGAGGADQQEPAGRLPGLRLRGEQLDAGADGRQGRPRAGPRPGRRSAARTSSASSRTSSRPATSTTPATTTQVLDKALELADYDHWRAEQAKRLAEEGRYLGIGVISAQERSVFSATEFWFWFDEPGAPVTSTPRVGDAHGRRHRRDHRHAVLLRVLGQQPGDDGRAVRRRGVRLRPARRLRSSTTAPAAGSPPPGPAAHGPPSCWPARSRARRRRSRRKRRARRGAPARDRRPTTWSGPTAASRSRATRAAEEPGRDRGHAAPVQAQLPRGHGKRAGGVEGLRPPLHDDAVRRPQGPRRLLPVHGPRLPHPGRRGGHRDRRGHVPALRGGARLRHPGQPALARRAHRRRDGAGHRDRPVRGVRLRRRRAVALVELYGLPRSRRRWRSPSW